MGEERALAVLVRFYRREAGAEPALEWLRSLERIDRLGIGLDLMPPAVRLAHRHALSAEPEGDCGKFAATCRARGSRGCFCAFTRVPVLANRFGSQVNNMVASGAAEADPEAVAVATTAAATTAVAYVTAAAPYLITGGADLALLNGLGQN